VHKRSSAEKQRLYTQQPNDPRFGWWSFHDGTPQKENAPPRFGLKRDYGMTLVILLYCAMTFFGVAVAAFRN
jgi:hypothetical protein